MKEIKTYVIASLTTTGDQERKIIEIFLQDVSRHHLLKVKNPESMHFPPSNFLQLIFGSLSKVEESVVKSTGLTDELLLAENCFEEDAGQTLVDYLNRLEPPVCICMYKGNSLNFDLLKDHLEKINTVLPTDLRCIDLLRSLLSIGDTIFSNIYEAYEHFLKRPFGGPNYMEPQSAEDDVRMQMDILFALNGKFVKYVDENSILF